MRSIVAMSIVLAWVAPASADDDPDKLFVQGRELLRKGDAVGACGKFHQVNRARPDAPSVLLNLGLCYEAQDKLATALYWFRKASDKATEAQPQTDETREFDAAARERKNALTPNVATIKIDLAATQAEVVIAIDGERKDRNVLADAIEVDQGKHTIEASAPGMKTHTQEIEIANKEKGKAVAIPALEPAPPEPVPQVASRRPRGKKAMIIGGIVGGVSGAAAITIRVAGLFEDESGDSKGFCQNYEAAGCAIQTGLGVGVLAGTAIGVIGLYWYLRPYPGGQPEKRMAITPVVSKQFSGLSLGGRF
jgi:hypothetical protein